MARLGSLAIQYDWGPIVICPLGLFFIILVSEGKIDNSSDVDICLLSMRTQSYLINDEGSVSL